jgi:hypothetical protein
MTRRTRLRNVNGSFQAIGRQMIASEKLSEADTASFSMWNDWKWVGSRRSIRSLFQRRIAFALSVTSLAKRCGYDEDGNCEV